MGMYINTNISSLNAQNNLSTSQMSLQTSLQRLSSGLRINSAKDDAAGLAISTRMSSQINGLSQASQNANDGISMSQTAEGGMATISDNLQRMRTLAVQAANGSNSTSDRQSIQAEISQLQTQINQVATQTQYNGTNLLDGSLSDAQFQIGSNANQTLNMSIGNLQANAIGSNTIHTVTTANATSTVNMTSNLAVTATSSFAGTMTQVQGFGGTQNATSQGVVGATTSAGDTILSYSVSGSGTAASPYVVPANNNWDSSSGSYGALNGTISVSGNGTSGQVTTTNGETADQIAASINSNTNVSATGVTASATTTVTLGGFSAGVAVSLNLYSSSSATGATPVKVAVSNGTGATDLSGLVSSINSQSGTSGITAVYNQSADTITLTNVTGQDISVQNASSTTAANGNAITVAGSDTAGITLQPAGTGGASAAGDTATVGGQVNFTSPSSYSVQDTNTNVLGTTSTVGSELSSVNSINVDTIEGANSAIQTIDAALKNVNNQEANMGAVQNRFTSVISNLATSGENLTSARSLIEDTNFASETANMTKSQILQQAGTAMLAQANSAPNGVMALLK